MKTKSLAASSGVIVDTVPEVTSLFNEGSVLPSAFDAVVAPLEESGCQTAYATFISNKSKLWPQLAVQIPGLQEPDVVLVRPKPDLPLKCSPFRFSLLTAKQYWADADDDGTLLRVSLSKPPFSAGMKEMVEAVVLVHLAGEVHAARMTFKTTKCGAVKAAVSALAAASTPEWGKLSPAHEASLAAPRPYLRFITNVSCQRVTSKSSGYAYWRADGVAVPTTPNDFIPLAKFFSSKANTDGLSEMKESHDRRLAEVEAIAKKG